MVSKLDSNHCSFRTFYIKSANDEFWGFLQKDNHNFESDNPTAEDDIANRKCSWLAVVALQRVTKAQREILQVSDQ